MTYARRRWPREAIISAIQRFVEAQGVTPRAQDFEGNPAYPSSSRVIKEFGNWGNAIEMAGFARPKQGRRSLAERRPAAGTTSVFSLRDVHTKPFSGPAEREIRDFETAQGERMLSPFDESDEANALSEQIALMRHDEVDLEVDLFSAGGGNSKPAPRLRTLTMSRGGKVKRIAEAMARLRGELWWQLELGQKQAYLTLAEWTVTALEVVEQEERELASPTPGQLAQRERRLDPFAVLNEAIWAEDEA